MKYTAKIINKRIFDVVKTCRRKKYQVLKPGTEVAIQTQRHLIPHWLYSLLNKYSLQRQIIWYQNRTFFLLKINTNFVYYDSSTVSDWKIIYHHVIHKVENENHLWSTCNGMIMTSVLKNTFENSSKIWNFRNHISDYLIQVFSKMHEPKYR